MDFTHKINHLSFGNIKDIKHVEKTFNEKFKFELDGRYVEQDKYAKQLGGGFGPQMMFVNYFLEISQVDYVDETTEEAKSKELSFNGF